MIKTTLPNSDEKSGFGNFFKQFQPAKFCRFRYNLILPNDKISFTMRYNILYHENSVFWGQKPLYINGFHGFLVFLSLSSIYTSSSFVTSFYALRMIPSFRMLWYRYLEICLRIEVKISRNVPMLW